MSVVDSNLDSKFHHLLTSVKIGQHKVEMITKPEVNKAVNKYKE